jgi:excisionase family DNA binding protein
MTQRATTVPRIALTRAEAAASLGLSVDSFERYVQPDVRIVRRGRLRLIPVSELEAWTERNAARVLDP